MCTNNCINEHTSKLPKKIMHVSTNDFHVQFDSSSGHV